MTDVNASDFDDGGRQASASVAAASSLMVAGIAVTGFVEGCLHVTKRPIPLRFATQYALWNILPSAVWKSVPASHIASMCDVPLTSLVTSSTSSSLSARQHARRLAVLKSLRTVRGVTATYGLVWLLWQTQSKLDVRTSENDIERVLRVANPSSWLSRVSQARHGDHIRFHTSSTSTIDWSALGLRHSRNPWHTVPVIEVEVDGQSSVEHIQRSSLPKGSRLVHIVSKRHIGQMGSLPRPSKSDVVVDSTCLYLAPIIERCDKNNLTAVVLHVPIDSIAASAMAEALSSRLLHSASALCQVWSAEAPQAGDEQDSTLHVVLAEDTSQAQEVMNSHAINDGDLKVSIFVNESLAVKKQPLCRSPHVQWISIADTSDDVLQRIRQLSRQGVSTAGIQDDLRSKLGPQLFTGDARSFRSDKHSDIGRYL
ncbi:TPA: hypothetical protein N0F65_005513 [Lagenidium giganteum]|uniref:Uncharacterized protein n=1 Tax=Lagenidium giganteum TaxID=4803 RepID=A0AAV2YIS8_9STRA|nr:TPA: hypothetical protein N0F65_005513 [Lagenidium giganteum]